MSGRFECQDPRPRMGAGYVGCCSPATAPFPSRKAVKCLVMVRMQQHRKSKCSVLQCQLVVTSHSLAFLTYHSAFLPLLLVQLYTVAENCFWLPVFSVWLYTRWVYAVSVSHGNVSCSQPEDVCMPTIQHDERPPEITTWKPGMLQIGGLPGRSQRNLSGTCWQFTCLQPKILIVRCINFRKQTFSICCWFFCLVFFFPKSQYTAVK